MPTLIFDRHFGYDCCTETKSCIRSITMVLPRRPKANEVQTILGRSRKQTPWQRIPRNVLVVAASVLIIVVVIYIGHRRWEQTREIIIPPPPNWRFPEYGKDRFFQTCPWISSSPIDHHHDDTENEQYSHFVSTKDGRRPQQQQQQQHPDCITRVHPKPDEYEGVAEWLSKVVSGFIDSRLRHCLLLLDYGDSIRLDQVVQPISFDWSTKEYADIHCKKGSHDDIATKDNSDIRCDSFAHRISHNILSPKQRELGVHLQPSGIHIPNYRHVFKNMTTIYNLHNDQFEDLKQALPGFQLETGFACSMASTWKLTNPLASQFQPNLFSELLPQLRDPNSIVITVYIRSGQTDLAATAEKEGHVVVSDQGGDASAFENLPEVQNTLSCVRDLELLALEGESHSDTAHDKPTPTSSFPPPITATTSIPNIIWLLVTDSVPLKTWVQSKFDQKPVPFQRKHGASLTTNRVVLTTTAKGTHTRASRNPQTEDFAEAFLDWWLMGEADALVTSSSFYSFGTSASLRTAIPLYDGSDCTILPVVQEGPSPRKKQEQK